MKRLTLFAFLVRIKFAPDLNNKADPNLSQPFTFLFYGKFMQLPLSGMIE